MIRTPFWAATPVPTITAVGVASPKEQGQAMQSTVMDVWKAKRMITSVCEMCLLGFCRGEKRQMGHSGRSRTPRPSQRGAVGTETAVSLFRERACILCSFSISADFPAPLPTSPTSSYSFPQRGKVGQGQSRVDPDGAQAHKSDHGGHTCARRYC